EQRCRELGQRHAIDGRAVAAVHPATEVQVGDAAGRPEGAGAREDRRVEHGRERRGPDRAPGGSDVLLVATETDLVGAMGHDDRVVWMEVAGLDACGPAL